jgi:hypothetical protein
MLPLQLKNYLIIQIYLLCDDPILFTSFVRLLIILPRCPDDSVRDRRGFLIWDKGDDAERGKDTKIYKNLLAYSWWFY